MTLKTKIAGLGALFLLPVQAVAQTTLTVSTFGFGNLTFDQIIQNILTVLQGSIFAVCVGTFIVGAFFFVIYYGNEEQKTRGKNLMIGSLVGIAVVTGAKAIMNLVLYFIYGA